MFGVFFPRSYSQFICLLLMFLNLSSTTSFVSISFGAFGHRCGSHTPCTSTTIGVANSINNNNNNNNNNSSNSNNKSGDDTADTDEPSIYPSTHRLTSKSGLPVCRYALGGAARSTQPKNLVKAYYDDVVNLESTCGVPQNDNDHEKTHKKMMTMAMTKTRTMAPFYFYYNPHRYPDFMKGIQELVDNNHHDVGGDDKEDVGIRRDDLFLASGGTDRSDEGMEQRLEDALQYSGKEYLDMFVLEYVCPEEVDDPEFLGALQKARSWVDDGTVRYVAASTHSHKVGAWLGSLKKTTMSKKEDSSSMLDALMLRYNMAHKHAAEQYSFPVCVEAGIPVLAFTTTRWNKLQAGHPDWLPDDNDNNDNDEQENEDDLLSSSTRSQRRTTPTTSECLSFALSSSSSSLASVPSTSSTTTTWPVEIVLHSARSVDELREALPCLLSTTPTTTVASSSSSSSSIWREYGDLDWNDLDDFDEYPEEQAYSHS